MKAIAISLATSKALCIDHVEPKIQKPDEVKIKVLEVGVCGTDSELVEQKRILAPPGEDKLIIGHEMLGQVMEVGPQVTSFKKGDLAIVTVRRGCEKCFFCQKGRFDLCSTGNYRERGIKQYHGFNAEYVVDQEKFLIQVPHALRSCAVLCEPTSVVEKAIDVLCSTQKSRLPDWGQIPNKKALVIGLGPIGLIACLIFKLRGFDVFGQDVVPKNSPKAKMIEEIGGHYINGKETPYAELAKSTTFDVVLEAAGIAVIDFQLFDLLACNGACVLTGIPNPHATFSLEGGRILQQIVLKNQLLLGSVNASKQYWQSAVSDLEKIEAKWKGILPRLITGKFPYAKFKDAIFNKSADSIKNVVVWE